MTNPKAGIASSYMEETKSTFLGNPYPPDYPGRNALIVGGTEDNIGGAIAKALPFSTTLTQRNAGNLESFYELSDFDTIIFVNGETHLDWIEDQPAGDIKSVIYNSLVASILGTSQFVNSTLYNNHRKHIVYIGSMAYKNVLNGSAPYCAAKAGLSMFGKCMAWELAPKNYDVFTVHPSNTEGMPMTEATIQGLMRFRNLDRETAEAYWGASLPKDRWLQGFDIGTLVAFLVSGNATYLSGCDLDLAGGQR